MSSWFSTLCAAAPILSSFVVTSDDAEEMAENRRVRAWVDSADIDVSESQSPPTDHGVERGKCVIWLKLILQTVARPDW